MSVRFANHFKIIFEFQYFLNSLRTTPLSSASRTVIRFMDIVTSKTLLSN